MACALASRASLLLLDDTGVLIGVFRKSLFVGDAALLGAKALLMTSDAPDSV